MNASYAEILLAGFILIFPFLYESSHVFRYHLKFILYYTIVMIISVILIPLFAFKPKDVSNLVTASALCHHISTLLGLKWILQGKEHLEKDEACVIVANHQSSIDILGMFDLWPTMDKCTVVAKKGLFYAWPFGLAAWLCGLIFIPRVNSQESRSVMNKAAKTISNSKTKLWIFPEGTRRNTGQIHDFKKGAFHLAITTGLPILPVVFSRYYFLDDAGKRFDRGTVFIKALPRISTEDLTLKDIDKLIEDTRNTMISAFNELNSNMRDNMNAILPPL